MIARGATLEQHLNFVEALCAEAWQEHKRDSALAEDFLITMEMQAPRDLVESYHTALSQASRSQKRWSALKAECCRIRSAIIDRKR